jgi:hypothetical protein
MTSLPTKITLTYTLKVPITFQDFVEFANKSRDEEQELSTQDKTAKEIWSVFIKMMEAKNNKLPSGKDVDINSEPDHETIYILTDLVEEAITEVEDTDSEDEKEADVKIESQN